MESKGDKALTGVPRWACPWPTEAPGVHSNSCSTSECDLLSPPHSDRLGTDRQLLNSERRLQRIGIAATSVAASVWLLAAIWVWEIVRL